MTATQNGSGEHTEHAKNYLLTEPEFKIEGVSTGYRWYVFGILALLYAFDYADRLVMGAVQEMIRVEWALTDTQISWLSTVIWLTVGFLALPVSFLIDRWSRRKSISIMAMIWSIATLACRFVPNFGSLLFFRGVLGFGEAGYSAGAFPLLSAYFSREKRAMVFGLFSAFTAIGAATGVLVGGHIANAYGWRWSFGVVAIPGIILAILAWFIKDYETVPIETSAKTTAKTVGKTIIHIMKIPSFIFAAIGTMFHDIAFAGLMMWLTTFIIRYRMPELDLDVATAKASTISGIIMLMALVGSPLGGVIAHFFYKRTPRGRSYTAAISTFFMAVMIFVFAITAENVTTPVFMVLGILMGISVTLYIAADASLNQDIVHQGYRSVVWGMRMIITMALGGAMGILLTGFLSDTFESLKVSIIIMSGFGVLASISYLIGARFYETDLKKVAVLDLKAEEK